MDGPSNLKNIHDRDVLILTIAKVAAARPDDTGAAARRLNDRLEPLVDVQRKTAQRHVRRRLALLEVARQHVLETMSGTSALMEPSSINTEHRVPLGFDTCCLGVQGDVPEWMKKCFELAGYFDVECAELFKDYVGYARNLSLGTWGDWSFPRPVELSQLTPKEMWLLLQTRPLSKVGEKSRPQSDLEHWEAETDEQAAASFAENYVAALADVAFDLLDDLESPLTAERAWDILLVTLLIMDPNFNADKAGVRGMPQWDFGEDGNWWRARSFTLFMWEDRSSNIELLCELALRAVRTLQPDCVDVCVATLTEAQVDELVPRLMTRPAFADAVRELMKHDTPPVSWSRKHLTKLANVSAKTIARIRKLSTLPPLAKGQRDIMYGPPDLHALSLAARKHAPGTQDWTRVADALESELRECGYLQT
jgi:hypothetical protein